MVSMSLGIVKQRDERMICRILIDRDAAGLNRHRSEYQHERLTDRQRADETLGVLMQLHGR